MNKHMQFTATDFYAHVPYLAGLCGSCDSGNRSALLLQVLPLAAPQLVRLGPFQEAFRIQHLYYITGCGQ
jgi:hypothetical protein